MDDYQQVVLIQVVISRLKRFKRKNLRKNARGPAEIESLESRKLCNIIKILSPLESNDFILHYLDIYLLVFFLSVGTLIKSNDPVVGPHTRAGVNLH